MFKVVKKQTNCVGIELWKIVTATINEICKMISLWEEQYRLHRDLDDIYYVPWSDLLQQRIEEYLKKEIADEDPHVLVAKINDEFVGLITYDFGEESYFDTSITKFGSIIEIIVSEKWRGFGIGESLIKYVEKEFFQLRGITDIRLQCSHSNPLAQKFYKRLGFEPRQILFYKT